MEVGVIFESTSNIILQILTHIMLLIKMLLPSIILNNTEAKNKFYGLFKNVAAYEHLLS